MKIYVLDSFYPDGVEYAAQRAEVVRWDDPRANNWHDMSDEDKLTNPVRQRMQAGGVSLGMPVRLGRSGDMDSGDSRRVGLTIF
jgi:hypothetical protein